MRRPLIPLLLTPFLLTASLLAGPADSAKAPKAPPPKSLLEGVEIYGLDAPHSEIGFTVPWMGISRVHGTFDDVIGSIAFDGSDLTRSSVMVVIRTNSIDTGFERRDKDLRGPDFFDVEKYPSITFASREIVKRDDSGYIARGPLTIHGVTKDIEIPFAFNGQIKDGRGDRRVGFEGRLKLKRKDYGIVGPARMNVLLEKGIIIGEEIDIAIAVEGWKATHRDTMQDRVADSLYRIVLNRGFGPVARQFRELRAKTPDSLMTVDEGVLNAVGYQLLEHNPAEALEMFRLETDAWPKNVFGYVGLGQTYATLGNRDLAITTLEKAIAITPEAPRAQVILKRIRG